jgi:hypothetical protein
MDGSHMLSGTLLTPGQVDDLGWTIVGAGDFSGDDEWDLVWQHADGRVAVWLMHGTTLFDGSLVSAPQVADATWRIHGVGDVNGDGHCDLIWQNEWKIVGPR